MTTTPISATDPLIWRATELAVRCHEGQIRKGDGAPYIVHPIRVALYLAQAGLRPEVIAAGLLHDTVEETHPEKRHDWWEELAKNTPRRVQALVQAVSDADPEAPWQERKEAYLRSIEKASCEALAIACADKLDNAIGMKKVLERDGAAAMRRFNAPLDVRIAYFHAIASITERRWPDCPLIHPLRVAIKELEEVAA
ncbi:MAG: bifunctional (p)ppGpp synthetase/guanosine-3',5'-bis(diphosphate) 3'-pyrophosphohydrolase [Candidatus Omnitrophica bacterium]|nr:bifunctional (p)ppGpp synthetase/guanosine-3',5'-bis(diphosphate) 3'-pyrophosphohydrolase [Candidatus Omnitrophota bacterium]